MLKRYKKVVIYILRFLNYNKIGNENGSYHFVLNMIDLLLAIVYASISMWNLKSVTILVLVMNSVTLGKLIVSNLKNSINLRKKYETEYLSKPGLSYKSAYDIKLIIEFCVIFFIFAPFGIQGILLKKSVIRTFAGIVIWLSFLESFINIHVDMFEADMEL